MKRYAAVAALAAGILVVGASASVAKVPPVGNVKSTIGFTSATYTVIEDAAGFTGNAARIGLSRTGDTTTSQSVNCNVGSSPGTATVGVDYSATAPWVANFGVGAKNAYCEIPIVADTADEVTETIKLVLSGTNLAPGKSTAVLSILDDDIAGTLESNADFAWNEECVGCLPAGSAFVYPVTLVGGGTHPAPVTVAYAFSNGTATGGASCLPGVDYVNTGGLLTFPAAVNVKSITVTICNDSLDEVNETFTSTLSSPTNAALGDATTQVTILDSDSAGSLGSYVDFAWNEECVGCIPAGNAYVYPVTLTGDATHANPVTVDYAFADGTATGGAACTSGVDYVNTGGTLTFLAGVTSQNVTVPICDDLLGEGDESFTSTLTNPANATIGDATTVVTIQASDPNEGFETGDLTGWDTYTDGDAPVASVSSASANSGTYSVLLGTPDPSCTVYEPLGVSSVYREFAIPATGVTTLSFWVNEVGDGFADSLFGQVQPSGGGAAIAPIFNDGSNSTGGLWVQKTLNLTPYAGSTVRLLFGVYQDAGGCASGMYLDDVAVSTT